MLIRLSEVRMKDLYPNAENVDYDRYYLVDEKFRNGTVTFKMYNKDGHYVLYLLNEGDYIANELCNTVLTSNNLCVKGNEELYKYETRVCMECKIGCCKQVEPINKYTRGYYNIEEGTCFVTAEEARGMCNHIFNNDNVCVNCGQKYTTETRQCGECECFHERPYKGWPTCGKRMMDVTKDMNVFYSVEVGPCFEDGSTGAKI
ncbi:MAG: hypothetical protein WCS56_00320 [Bacilli bacterium]